MRFAVWIKCYSFCSLWNNYSRSYILGVLCLVVQSYLTLCDFVDCSPPGSSLYGILQARILEWVALSSSRGSSWPRDWAYVSCGSCIAGGFFYHWATWEAPMKYYCSPTPNQTQSGQLPVLIYQYNGNTEQRGMINKTTVIKILREFGWRKFYKTSNLASSTIICKQKQNQT